MAFSLSFAGVQVRITPSSNSNANFCIKSVRHDDGVIEAEVCNFNGTIIISGEESLAQDQDQQHTNCREVVVDAVPEELDCPLGCLEALDAANANENKIIEHGSSFMTANSTDVSDLFVPPISQQSSQFTVEIDSGDDDEEKKIQSPVSSAGGVRFDLTSTQVIHAPKPKVDLSLHKACASEDTEIDDLRELLRTKPELATIQDEYGDYAAHIFANNDSFIYTSSDYDVQQFAFELYKACPRAFLTEGYDGYIPFAGTITDWVDECHVLYQRSPREGVFRVSEIKSLTKSTRVINSLCARESIQKFMSLPTEVKLTPKVIYCFQMLSFILDTLTQSAFKDISTRREFWAVASKRRDKIIGGLARVPFIVRTILLIDNKAERDALIDLSIVRNLMFRPESVDLWLVALLSGGERARACATHYLCLISRFSLSGIVGKKMIWGEADSKRFHSNRETLYREVGKLDGFLPCMLHLGDSLYDVSTRRAVKYVVESTIGRPLPVYVMFMEAFLLVILMTSYRIIVELVYAIPSEEFLSQHRDFWGLALSIAAFFTLRDIAILVSFFSTEEKLARRYVTSFGNMIGYVTTTSVITVLSVLYVKSDVAGRNYVGIVSGLLWWKFLLHIKGMSENLSTLIYTIIQIAATLKYFLAIFLITIFFFADMIDIVKKTSGDCDYVDGEMESGLATFCSLTPLESYLAMYGVMIGGMELSWLEGSSPLVIMLFVAASFCGVIVLVNILIAIVTGEYEKAQARSCHLFARARLEAAARQVARERLINPPDDPTSGIGRKLWRISGKLKFVGITFVVEYFLIKSLLSSSSLHSDGIVGDFLYVALILCSILYHLFLVAAILYLIAKAICNYDSLRWLRGSKLHVGLLKICLLPVCGYMRSIGLGKGERCPDASDMNGENDHPLLHNEFVGKQADFEVNIQEAIQASETRILHAVKSIMFQIPPE